MENIKHLIGGQELAINELIAGWNIPKNSTVLGKNLVSTDANSFIRRENYKQIWNCFPLDGVSDKTYDKIYDYCFSNNELSAISIFNSDLIGINELRGSGLGPKQSNTFITNLHKYKGTSITFDLALKMLNIVGCGNSIRKQYGHKLSNNEYDFSGLTKDIINQLDNSMLLFVEVVKSLKTIANIDVVAMESETKVNTTANIVTYVMTGRPGDCGFVGTKKQFQEQLPSNWIEVKKMLDTTTYLIAGDSNSNSSKAKTARKLGVTVITYVDVNNKLK